MFARKLKTFEYKSIRVFNFCKNVIHNEMNIEQLISSLLQLTRWEFFLMSMKDSKSSSLVSFCAQNIKNSTESSFDFTGRNWHTKNINSNFTQVRKPVKLQFKKFDISQKISSCDERFQRTLLLINFFLQDWIRFLSRN